jgi:hypothetical protein
MTKLFLGQYISSLMQETVRFLKLSYSDLALKMFIPEMVLRDSVEGKMALTRGQWAKLVQILGLPTTYESRPDQREWSAWLGSLFPTSFNQNGQNGDRGGRHPGCLPLTRDRFKMIRARSVFQTA